MSRRASRLIGVLVLGVLVLAGSLPSCVEAGSLNLASGKPASGKPATRPTPEASPSPDPSANDTYKQLTLFSDVFERARAEYVDPITDEKLVENAINGMLTSLDPHSGYLNKKNFEDMQTQTRGEFGGLGLEVTMENNLVKVISPIDETPAARAGMQPNDLITHLDSKPVMDMTLGDAVDKMRGTPGTKITLTIRRGGISGQPFDVTLTRAVIRVRSVRWEIKDDVAYVRITTFNEQTQPGLDKALAEIESKMGDKMVGMVLDLRNNPGGLLDQAISVSGTFIGAGREVVSTRSRHKEDQQSFVSRGGDKIHGKPIVVLINGGSASASEIVAGALQDYRRAVVLGTKSFGKGSVQTIIPLAGSGSAMRLTTARYYTPSGRSIQQLGIEPDITVQPAKVEEINPGQGLRESDLKGALVNETAKDQKKQKDKDEDKDPRNTQEDQDKSEKDSGKDGKEDKNDKDSAKDKKDKKAEAVDYQLARALDLLRGIHLYESRTKNMLGQTEPVANKTPAPEGKTESSAPSKPETKTP